MKPSLPSASSDLPAPSAAAGARLRYRRVLLKLSGEAFAGPQQSGINSNIVRSFARQLHEVHDLGCELALVVGGGNIYRGAESSGRGFDRVTGDYMGMLATVINALALQHELEGFGVHTRVMSAIAMQEIAEPYIRRRATRHLEKGRVVIFGGGTGNPFFTTDTAAGLRAMEIAAEVIFKATKVDGVFDADPMLVPTARKYGELSYLEVLKQGLKVMDATAISLCMDNKLPILVFNLLEEGNIRRAVLGEDIGTLVHEGSHDRSGSG